MKQRRLALSVVTYTFNDHELVAGLLASMAAWDVAPREIIVVDDGSTQPFVLPAVVAASAATAAAAPLVPRIIRLEPNQGPARAKVAGLNAAGQRFLLSLDADIRLPPDWISRCLREAANPDVGIVATPILTEVGSTLLAAYQQLRYSHWVGFSGEANVAPAGLWLLRREVWLQYGFHDYAKRLHEDVHFSQTLRQAGLALRILAEPVVRQIRRLSRRTMVRRGWTWQGREFIIAARNNPIDPVNALLLAVQIRMATHRAANPAFLYYDCLYLAFALTGLLRAAGYCDAARCLPAALADDLPHPRAAALLRADLAALGLDGLSAMPPLPSVPSATPAGAPPAASSGASTSPLVDAVRQGVRSILPDDAAHALELAMPHLEAEDARDDWDFSFYDATADQE